MNAEEKCSCKCHEVEKMLDNQFDAIEKAYGKENFQRPKLVMVSDIFSDDVCCGCKNE